MFYNIFSMRPIQVGIVFFLIVVAGSLLYSWHAEQTPKAELAATRRMRHPSESLNVTGIDPQASEATDTVIDDSERFHEAAGTYTTDTQTSEASEALTPIDIFQLLFQETDVAENIGESEVSEDENAYGVSPFGYGEYPNIPIDYPWNPIWTFSDEKRKGYSDNDPEFERGLELMDRVALKVWKSGRTDFKGMAFSRGRVYLNFPNIVYAQITENNGLTTVDVIGTAISEEEIMDIGKGINPRGITVLDMSDGIEAISFLGLSDN